MVIEDEYLVNKNSSVSIPGPVAERRSSDRMSTISIEKLFIEPTVLTTRDSTKEAKSNAIERFLHWIKACFHDKTLRDEIVRTLVAASIFICTVGAMTLAQMCSDRWFALYTNGLVMSSAKVDELKSDDSILTHTMALQESLFRGLTIPKGATYATDPLFDHISAMLPDKSAMRSWLPDMFLSSFLIVSLLVTLLFPAYTRLKYQSVIVARRIFWILSILYTFRMASFLATTVPNPVQNCIPKYPADPSAYLLLMGRMATGKVSACTDNIYSGHTTLATVLFFTNIIYARRWYFSIYSFIHLFAIVFAIVLTRLHYSVDVLIALFMTSFIYCLYHFLLLIKVDGMILCTLRTNNGPSERDTRLMNERRIFLRLTGESFLKLLSWMDGMDMRTGKVQEPALVEESRDLSP